MKFHLSDEQIQIQQAIRDAAADLCKPEMLRGVLVADSDFDAAVWEGFMALGLGGIAIPERFGGMGLGLLDAALTIEVLGEAAVPGSFMSHVLAGLAIAACEDEALKAEWLPKLASGEAKATFALSDGWMPDRWSLQLAANRVSGGARFVLGADEADLFVVGLAGGDLAIVLPGEHIVISPIRGFDLTRRLATVRFDSAPAQLLLGAGIGFKLFDAGLVLIAADALGGAARCMRMSVEYSLTREQFGAVIAQFQAVKHQLAQMVVEIEPARALVWFAAHAWDAGLPETSRAAAQAKAHLCERFVSVVRAAVEVHGGIGYTWEYDLHIWFRRSQFDYAFMGEPASHRERIAALSGW